MCGRFKITSPPEIVAEAFGLDTAIAVLPRYNVAPTQDVAAVRMDAGGHRILTMLRWGLIPAWAKDATIGNRMINARAETVAEKPSFRRAFATRRCLVVGDGYYEWARGRGGRKTPYLFSSPDRRPFGFAGLWEVWRKGEQTIESCVILTTEAVGAVARVHDRMPVVVAPSDYATWLGTATGAAASGDVLAAVLRHSPGAAFEGTRVGTHVNNPRNDDAACVSPDTEIETRDPPE